MKPVFFATPSLLRKWFEKNHEREKELWLGYYKRDSGRASVTWPESVDQALCFGWIDGVRKSLGDESYMIRFTPRKPKSKWSAVNLKRVAELERLGLMHARGRETHANRVQKRAGYSYEERIEKLPAKYEKQLRANKAAWKYYSAQPPWYRRTSAHWVVRAVKEETRLRRLEQLIECSAAGRPIGLLTRPSPS
jgi:uncharacterized protein YdeI (YjbR/CyaY-like superfamily)